MGIMGPGNPAAKFLLFPGDWLVMPQPGYVYKLPKSQVQADEQDELAPVQRIREARADEAFRPTVEAIRTLWVRSGGRAEAAQVFGLRRVAPLYVYGQMAPTCIPGTMHVDAGQYEVGANVWVEPSPLLMCEDGLRKTSPRVAPLILLGREFARWTRQDGEVIHDFGELPD